MLHVFTVFLLFSRPYEDLYCLLAYLLCIKSQAVSWQVCSGTATRDCWDVLLRPSLGPRPGQCCLTACICYFCDVEMSLMLATWLAMISEDPCSGEHWPTWCWGRLVSTSLSAAAMPSNTPMLELQRLLRALSATGAQWNMGHLLVKEASQWCA